MSVNSVGYLPHRSGSVNIHRYSPPLWRIIVNYYIVGDQIAPGQNKYNIFNTFKRELSGLTLQLLCAIVSTTMRYTQQYLATRHQNGCVTAMNFSFGNSSGLRHVKLHIMRSCEGGPGAHICKIRKALRDILAEKWRKVNCVFD